MAGMDLFSLYRRLLLIVVAAYATARTVQTVAAWRRELAGEAAGRRVARRYVGALLLSIRMRRFWVDLVDILLLAAVLIGLLVAHGYV